MKTAQESASKIRRRRQIAIGALVLAGASLVLSVVLHRAALGQLEEARRHMGQGDWLAALRRLDRARREDPFLIDVYLLRATAIAAYIPPPSLFVPSSHGRLYTNEEALSDVEMYLRYRPESGDARYLRGSLLGRLGRRGPAREELARAIPLLKDPTRAIVERAGLSLLDGDPKAAVEEISQAIERHPLEPALYESRALYRRFVFDHRGADEDRARAEILSRSKGIALEELEARVRDRLGPRRR